MNRPIAINYFAKVGNRLYVLAKENFIERIASHPIHHPSGK
jgi:hypothetical protein